MCGRDNSRYSIRLFLVLFLSAIFITPSMIVGKPTVILDRGNQSTGATSEAMIKVDPQLRDLISRQTEGNVKVIAVLGDQVEVAPFEGVVNGINGLRVLAAFRIVPAVLIEGSLSRISTLFSVKEIRSLYLNKEIKLEPFSNVPKQAVSVSPTPTWIQAIDLPPLSVANGAGVKIAIADSGIDGTHMDLQGKVVASESFVNTIFGYLSNDTSTTDNYGHGTYVAGIAAGSGVVNPEYRGVAPNAKLLNAKCIDDLGRGFTAGIIAAIQWSVDNGADVVSLSLGGGFADPDDPLSQAADNAARGGVVVVASAGNGGPYYSTGETPAAARLAISVGAYNQTNSVASFSSRGPTLDGRSYPDILAPGVDIVSTLASGSSISEFASRLGLSQPFGGYYLPLDGTSAAAPFVSGAAALLLSATGLSLLNRSNLPSELRVEVPTTIRIALMRTAKNLGADVNIQGSGLLDVYSAYNYLIGYGDRLHYPIINVYPRQLVNPPDFIGYLGDSVGVAVSVLTAFKANLNVIVSGNATGFMRLGNTSLTDIVGLTVLDVNVSIPVNATLGAYTAQIGFENATTHEFVSGQNVTVSFSVTVPKGRIYFDLYHTDSTFSTRGYFYKLASALTANGYSIFESDEPITYSKISQHDILVLVVPKVMFGVEEVNAIRRFVRNNGSLLVLGSFYPDMVAERVNEIMSGYGIQYNTDFIARYDDLVFAEIITSGINVTSFSSHPVTSGLSSYLYGYGSTLSVGAPATAVCYAPPDFGGLTVLAACDLPEGGRIVASGSSLFASDDYLLDSSYPGNLKLAENIFEWLIGQANSSLEAIVPKSRVRTSEPFQIGVAVVNRTVGGLLSSTLTCIADNGSVIPVVLSSDVTGVYYNMTVEFQSEGFYAFSLNASIGLSGLEVSKTFSVEVISTPPDILNVTLAVYNNPAYAGRLPTIYRSFLPTGAPIIFRYGDYVNFTMKLTGLVQPGSNVTVYLTRYPNFYLSNDKPLTYVSLKATQVGSTDYYEAQYHPSLSNTTDTYQYWICANNAGHLSTFSAIGTMMVASVEPEIDNTTTILNGRPLTDLRTPVDDSVWIYPMFLYAGDTISVVIDGVDTEDDISKMSAWVILLDPSLYIVPGIVSAELIISPIPFDNASRTFQGNVQLPASGIAYSEDLQTDLSLLNGFFYLLILLVDSDGAYASDFAGVEVMPFRQIPVEVIFVILGVSVIIPLLIIFVLRGRSTRRLEEGAPRAHHPTEPL